MIGRWLAFLLLGSGAANAFRTSIERRDLGGLYTPALARQYLKRDGTSGDTDIGNIANSQYVANITVGGGNFVVILDTGSSDLWVTGTVPNSTDTGTHTQISYAVGEAAGNIHTAEVTFSDFTVPEQAFIYVTDSSTFGSITAVGINGLAGLGPSTSSVVFTDLGTKGDALLENIFQLNKTSSNFVTFLLTRASDPAETIRGEFTISEVISGYENITNQPKLDVQVLSNKTAGGQHWTALLDKMIGPDGKQMSHSSIVKDTPSGHLATVFDSGFTLPQVPRKVSDSIYGRVQGAEYDSKNGWWVVPCSQELNISFVLGGQMYPVHPLDTVSSDYGGKFSNGSTGCVGTFQPITSAFSIGGEFDVILGEAFLRNTYTLLDMGDFVDETTNARGTPFVQLQSITDMAQAHQDFVKVRLNGVDTTSDASHKLLDKGKSSPVPDSERVQHLEGFAYRNRAAIAAGTIGAALLIVLAMFLCWCRRRRAARRARGGSQSGLMPLGSTASLPYNNDQSHNYNAVHANSTSSLQMTKMHQSGYQDPYYQHP